MKKELKLGFVGMDPEPIKEFVSLNKAQLETETLSLPGRHGEKGMKVVRTDNLSGPKPVVLGLEVERVKYTVFYS